MSEIQDYSEVCRCCHSSGVFKSLLEPFTHEGNVEVYSDLIREVLAIHIRKPASVASYSICEQCIMQLRFCQNFKLQVLECERKFQEYFKNEFSGFIKTENDENQDADMGTTQTSVANTKPKEQSKTVGKPFRCEFCNQRFDSKQKMQEHEIKKHCNDALCCKICELKFKTHSIRTMHMKKHNSSGKGLKCKHCDKYYGSENALIKHINTHCKDYAYKCEICSKTFQDKHALRRHIEWHKHNLTESHIKKLHECSICLVVFKKSSELRTHMVRNHNSHFKALEKSKKTLREHNFGQCKECDKVFTTNYTLKRHMLFVHVGVNVVKPKKCNLCNGTFSTISGLNRHIKNVHKKAKGRCDICDKLFTNLNEHKKTHSKEYKCDQCHKVFAANNYLNRHIKFAHLCLRPHACHLCESKYTHKRNWRQHLKKRHGVEPPDTQSVHNTDRIKNVSSGINELTNRLNST